MALPLFIVGFACITLLAIWKLLGYNRRAKGLPPGPPTLPVIGNIHQLDADRLPQQLRKWATEYGPLTTLQLGEQVLITINTHQGIKDLLDKESQNTSGRLNIFLSEYGANNQMFLRTNDDVWRRQRRMYHLRLNNTVANNYLPFQKFETQILIKDFLTTPDKYDVHIQRFTSSIAATMAYGIRVPHMDIPAVQTLYEWIRGSVMAGRSTALADWYPWIRPVYRHVPGWVSSFKSNVAHLFKLEAKLWLSLYEDAKGKAESGKLNPSFCNDMIELAETEKYKDSLTVQELAFNAGHAWAGASDTTQNSLMFFIKAMACFPEAQAKAHAELDEVIGSEHPPEWSDWSRLPYVRSCVKETWRWGPPTPTGGMPHGVTKTFTYNGYTIPKGAGLINNVWTINNDPSVYPNPRQFEPSRHLKDSMGTAESASQADATKRDHVTFGAGRRLCPGTHIADRSLFLAVSRLLWTFKFEELPAHPIDRDAFLPGFVATPEPFKVKITPRSEARAKMALAEAARCDEMLDAEGNYKPEYFTAK